MDAAGDQSEIVFEYNIGQDTPEKVATEMVREMQLETAAYHLIYQSLDQVERNYSDSRSSHPFLSDVPELLELEAYRDTSDGAPGAPISIMHSSGDSIKSEPILGVRHNEMDGGLGAASSWSEPASEPEYSFSEESGVTNLESLVDASVDLVEHTPRFPYTLPPLSDANDMTDLEDLLDDEDLFFDDDSDSHGEQQSELSSGEENMPPGCENLLPDSDGCHDDLTSEEEDEQAIQALKEKHELAMQALLKSQEDELRKATERRSLRKRGSTLTTPEMPTKNSERSSRSVPSLSNHVETTQALKNFYNKQVNQATISWE